MIDRVDTYALRAAGRRADYHQTGEGPLWRSAADEVDRLRAALENAPHANSCAGLAVSFGDYGESRRSFTGNCTCWKAESP